MLLVLTLVYLFHGFQTHAAPLTNLLAESSSNATVLSTYHALTYVPLISDRYGISFGAASPRYLLVHGYPSIPIYLPPMNLRGESSSVVWPGNSCSGL